MPAPPTDIEIELAAERARIDEHEMTEGHVNEGAGQRERRHQREALTRQALQANGHDATWAHLQQLEREHKRLLRHNLPVTSSLWLALMKPGQDVITRYRRALMDASSDVESSDDPTERPISPPAIIMLGETMVAKALLGDMAAAAHVAERIEGKPGVRRGEETPETQAARNVVLGAMREIVTMMVDAKHGREVNVTDVDLGENETGNETQRDIRRGNGMAGGGA